MNEKKLKQLFAAAQNEAAPEPEPGFAAGVLRAVRREPVAKPGEAFSIFDQLNLLFPRAVLAAAAVIVLCLAVDWMANLPELRDGMAQVTSQFLFNAEEL